MKQVLYVSSLNTILISTFLAKTISLDNKLIKKRSVDHFRTWWTQIHTLYNAKSTFLAIPLFLHHFPVSLQGAQTYCRSLQASLASKTFFWSALSRLFSYQCQLPTLNSLILTCAGYLHRYSMSEAKAELVITLTSKKLLKLGGLAGIGPNCTLPSL